MVWNSATSISVTNGACYIQGSSAVISFPSTLTLSSLTLTAATLYHVYAYLNAGVPAIEIVTTAPAAAYSGTARSKTGDTSRRYLGSLYAAATNAVTQFIQNGLKISYYANNTGAAPWRFLSGGTATTGTVVSVSSVCPVTARHVIMRVINTDTTTAMRLSNKDFGSAVGDSGSGTYAIIPIGPNLTPYFDAPMASDQSLVYWYVSSPSTGSANMDVFGYLYER